MSQSTMSSWPTLSQITSAVCASAERVSSVLVSVGNKSAELVSAVCESSLLQSSMTASAELASSVLVSSMNASLDLASSVHDSVSNLLYTQPPTPTIDIEMDASIFPDGKYTSFYPLSGDIIDEESYVWV